MSVLALASVAFFGLIIGSFLNVVIFRGPWLWGLVDGEPRGSLSAPRSYCPVCQAQIPIVGLIPVFGYLFLGGRCASCRSQISPRYPIVELLGAAAALLSILTFGFNAIGVAVAIFGWSLIALAFIDFETGYLPDAITWPLTGLGLIVNAIGGFTLFADALIGAVAGFLAFWAIGTAYEKIRDREGLGQGDKKLLGAIGAWSGWMVLPAVVFFAAVVTLAFAAAPSLIRKKDLNAPVPFGPGLCAAGFAALLLAPRLVSGL